VIQTEVGRTLRLADRPDSRKQDGEDDRQRRNGERDHSGEVGVHLVSIELDVGITAAVVVPDCEDAIQRQRNGSYEQGDPQQHPHGGILPT
jgi:hypothetical protein